MSTPRLTKSKSFWLASLLFMLLASCEAEKAAEKKAENPSRGRRDEDVAPMYADDLYIPDAVPYPAVTDILDPIEPHECPKGDVWYEGVCNDPDSVEKKRKSKRSKAIQEVYGARSVAAKAKASNDLLREQEAAMDVAGTKLDEILEDLQEDQVAK